MHFGIAHLAFLLSFLSLCWQVYTWWKERRLRLLVLQTGDQVTNSVSEVRNGTVYVLHAILINSSRAPVVIRRFELHSLDDLAY